MDTIKVDSVNRFFGENLVLKNIDLKVKQGSIHGLLGPNGAGKTTLMKVISGLLVANTGSVTIESQKENPFGLLLENPALFNDMYVTEYLVYVARLHSVNSKMAKKFAGEVIEQLSLGPFSKRLCGHLSKGLKQRVGIAGALIHKPDILILDEPTAGLDPQSVIEIRELVSELKKDHTVLLSSHLLHEIELICDHISIIDQGKLIVSDSVERIKEKISSNSLPSLSLKVKIESTSTESTKPDELVSVLKKIESWDFIESVENAINEKSLDEKKVIEKELILTLSKEAFSKDFRHLIIKKCVEQNVCIVGLSVLKKDLENIYIDLLGSGEGRHHD